MPLQFEAKLVPIGLRGSGWLASECKKSTYLDIFPVDPLWDNLPFWFALLEISKGILQTLKLKVDAYC
jgi:hypothetical protein